MNGNEDHSHKRMGMTEENPSSRSSDYRTILSGTSQNVAGIAVAALATFAAQILMTRTLGAEGFGVVTVVTQAAFVASFATRAGMDMAVLRDVAIEAGAGHFDRIRAKVSRAAAIALGISMLVAICAVAGADAIRGAFSLDPEASRWTVEAAAAGLPFLALANVWLAATRGLKQMKPTLYVFWAGQPLLWLVLMVVAWRFSEAEWVAAAAYSASWVAASVAAYMFWARSSSGWGTEPMEEGAMAKLWRYAGPRAPAALFSQLLFWADLFVLTRFVGDVEVGVYSAALRAGQMIVLFLTSVSLMFSPYVADLHHRGERERLDKLFKVLTRWTVAATLPVFVLLAVAPDAVLPIFGSKFISGRTALLILIAGQLVNILTGSVGFILIMVGRTGWDLLVYAGSLVMVLGLAFLLCPRYGMEGAAIANAATFTASKLARLALVRKFVHIQPYDRDYLRLLPPLAASAVLAAVAHGIAPEAWSVDLLMTGTAALVGYVGVYLVAGLTPAERKQAKMLWWKISSKA